MFFGAVPTDCIQQVFKIMDIASWGHVHVACSGSFRLERALSQSFADLAIHSNDVSVYSAVVAGAAMQAFVPVSFVNDLAFAEEVIAGCSQMERAAAVLVACEMSRYARGNTRYNQRHMAYFKAHFGEMVEKTSTKLTAAAETIRLQEYFSGDWRLHAQRAVEMGSGILAFPPFFKGDYEAQFAFIESNISWDAPSYDLYDPSQLKGIVDGLDAQGATYCILTDQLWEDREPVLKYHVGRKVPHYCYARTPRSSYLRKTNQGKAFRYRPVDVSKLSRDTKVEILQATSQELNFIKDVYLSKNIVHTNGFGNYMVMLDGQLAGAVIYDEGPVTRAAYGPRTLVLLSDVSVTTEGRLSKLIAMMGQSHALVRPLETIMLKRYERIVTTARTKNHVSMKYRGIFKKLSKRWDEAEQAHIIQYGAPIIDRTPQQIYDTWWEKHGSHKRAPEHAD